MKNHYKELLHLLNHQPGQKILDVGGAYDPVPIADVVIDYCNLSRGGGEYVLLDITTQTFPFVDNYFDICICSQTLEDLTSPRLALEEMSRVAKRGIIEVPHRGPESVRNDHYNSYKPACAMSEVWHFGVGHHKWLIEERQGVLSFVPKIQYMLMNYPIPQWRGIGGIRFQWEDYIPYDILYDIEEGDIMQNYERFRNENEQFWQ